MGCKCPWVIPLRRSRKYGEAGRAVVAHFLFSQDSQAHRLANQTVALLADQARLARFATGFLVSVGGTTDRNWKPSVALNQGGDFAGCTRWLGSLIDAKRVDPARPDGSGGVDCLAVA